jgi:hypothetical protein
VRKFYLQRRIRFRVIFPVIYFVIGGVLFLDCLWHIGHSRWCLYFFYSSLPASLIGSLAYLVIPWGAMREGSRVWQTVEVILVPLPFILAVVQYYLIGLLVDRLRARTSMRS